MHREIERVGIAGTDDVVYKTENLLLMTKETKETSVINPML